MGCGVSTAVGVDRFTLAIMYDNALISYELKLLVINNVVEVQ